MAAPESGTLTQAQRTALSDARMIDAAIQLIVEGGIETTTLKAVGDVSGYSRGLVPYRFGSKAGLFKAVIKTVSDRWLAELEKTEKGHTGLQAILLAAEAFYRFVFESPRDIRAMQILFHRAAEPGSELAGIVNRVYSAQREQLAAWVRAGQEQGEIRADVNPDSFAARFCAYTTGIMSFWMLDPQSIDWESTHAHFKATIETELTDS